MHFFPPQNRSSLGKRGDKKKEGGWTVSQTSEWKMSFVILVSAGRSLADMALQEWRFQSPLKWNYRALHSSVAFERFQQYAAEGRRQLENDTLSDYRHREAQVFPPPISLYITLYSPSVFLLVFSSLLLKIAISLPSIVTGTFFELQSRVYGVLRVWNTDIRGGKNRDRETYVIGDMFV